MFLSLDKHSCTSRNLPAIRSEPPINESRETVQAKIHPLEFHRLNSGVFPMSILGGALHFQMMKLNSSSFSCDILDL